MSDAAAASIVALPAGEVMLDGELHLPPDVAGVVVFSHGSGSGRYSPRNRFVAAELHRRSLGTLLLDLLTIDEDRDYARRFDIDLLTSRLAHAVRFVRGHPAAGALPIGLFGASTGAASALRIAARMHDEISAVVSRGGRPDLAGVAALGQVRAPTLLIVGEHDRQVIALNEAAREALVGCACELTIVPGATHLFEEPGALEAVAEQAGQWLARHLTRGGGRADGRPR